MLINAITAHQDVTQFTGMTRSFATLVFCLQNCSLNTALLGLTRLVLLVDTFLHLLHDLRMEQVF